jgi:putative tryptophan/tyrosine transport system substrate-binding protein
VAAKKATTTVPIVFVNVFDPLALGLISSRARSGGNITGLTGTSAEIAGKKLGLLKELIPKLRHVAILSHPPTPSDPKQIQGAEVAARALGMQIQVVPVHGPDEFDGAFKAMRGVEGLLPLEVAFFTTHRTRLVGLAATNRLPAIYGIREIVEAGGLMSYSVCTSQICTDVPPRTWTSLSTLAVSTTNRFWSTRLLRDSLARLRE